jgi:GxxExxY protein
MLDTDTKRRIDTAQGMNMDEQDSQDGDSLPRDLTKRIIGCAFEVINELGAGFLESVYEKSLSLALRQSGLNVELQKPVAVHFRSTLVGEFFVDLLVEGKFLVELKAVKNLAPEHSAQIINYLNATGIQVGLLINFGNPRLEYRRFTRSVSNKPSTLHPVNPVHPC